MKTSTLTHRSFLLMFFAPTLSLPTAHPQAVAPNPQNTFTIAGSSGPLTVQVFFDGNTPGTTPPTLTHPAISTSLFSLVKRLSAHASTAPLERAEQASVNGTMGGIRPEKATAGLQYRDAVGVMEALQGFLMGKEVDEEIDFVVDGALQGEHAPAVGMVLANGFVRNAVGEGREEGQ